MDGSDVRHAEGSVGAGNPDPRASWHRDLGIGALAFLLTLFVCVVSLSTNRQLGYLRGLSDRWLPLALNLADRGVFGEGDEPTMFKPPAYPALLGAALRLTLGRPPDATPGEFPRASPLVGLSLPYPLSYIERAALVTYAVNALLLAGSAAVTFLWLRSAAGAFIAFCAALMLGVNPYTLALVGTPHYAIAHVFTLVVALWVSARAVERDPWPAAALLMAGCAWGLATLVRPVTLLLPPFLLLAFLALARGRARAALRATLLTTAGMALVIAPWAARNAALSGRLVPVSAQFWANVWAGTLQVVKAQPDHYRWKELREPFGRILRRVPDAPLRTDPNAVDDNLALEDAFRSRALRNLSRRPGIYVENVRRSLSTFLLDINAVMVSAYEDAQRPDWTSTNWYWPGQAQDFGSRWIRRGFLAHFTALTLLAYGGALAGLWRRDRVVAIPLAAYACFAVAHALTWMDLMYYYVKVPFIIALAALAGRALDGRRVRLAGRTVPVGAAVAGLLAAGSVALTFAIL